MDNEMDHQYEQSVMEDQADLKSPEVVSNEELKKKVVEIKTRKQHMKTNQKFQLHFERERFSMDTLIGEQNNLTQSSRFGKSFGEQF